MHEGELFGMGHASPRPRARWAARWLGAVCAAAGAAIVSLVLLTGTSLAQTAPADPPDIPRPLASLKTVKAPEPPNLSDFVQDRATAIPDQAISPSRAGYCYPARRPYLDKARQAIRATLTLHESPRSTIPPCQPRQELTRRACAHERMLGSVRASIVVLEPGFEGLKSWAIADPRV
jgi:hypothetical protein